MNFVRKAEKKNKARAKMHRLSIHLIRAGEPEPGVFGSLEPEPEALEKKTRSRSRLLSPARRLKSYGNCTLVTLL